MKLGNWAVNGLLLLASIIMTFALIGYVIVYSGLIMRTPLKFQFALPPALAVLAQNSKAGLLPKNYILIVGDSYAKGSGDWLLSADPDTNPEYSSAHVLHRLTGRDVITYGKPGASSIKGWVREPSSLYPFLHNVIDSSIEPPDIVLAYFYTGNDIHENILQLQDDFVPGFGDPSQATDADWERYFNEKIQDNRVGPYRGLNTTFGWLINASTDVAKKSLKSPKDESIASVREVGSPNKNRVIVEGVATDFNYGFLAPGLDLSKQELDLSFTAASRSLHSLRQLFPNSMLVVVYVPSPAESYTLADPYITVTEPRDVKWEHIVTAVYPSAQLVSTSDEIARRMREIAIAEGAYFIDARDDIRKASGKELIHGPLDMTHFNKAGYTALAESLAHHLKTLGL